jgi:hypothetical protein
VLQGLPRSYWHHGTKTDIVGPNWKEQIAEDEAVHLGAKSEAAPVLLANIKTHCHDPIEHIAVRWAAVDGQLHGFCRLILRWSWTTRATR